DLDADEFAGIQELGWRPAARGGRGLTIADWRPRGRRVVKAEPLELIGLGRGRSVRRYRGIREGERTVCREHRLHEGADLMEPGRHNLVAPRDEGCGQVVGCPRIRIARLADDRANHLVREL